MSKSILCPECGWKVMTHDGKGTMDLKSRCRNCKLLVTYHPGSDKTTISKVPERDRIAGKRFY